MAAIAVDANLRRFLRTGVLLAGASSFALGFIVLVGWYTGNVMLVQVHPAFVPMQYNTALGFLLTGSGLLATTHGYVRVALGCGAAVLAIGLLTLSQYGFAIDLGIDQLLMQHYITVQTSHPGRMAPNTAVCFTLAGTTLLFAAWPRRVHWRAAWVSLMGAAIISLGIIALFGYLSGIETAYGWGRLTRMALHTAFGFGMAGGGLLLHGMWAQHLETATLSRWMPLPFGVAILGITVGLWQSLLAQESASIRAQSFLPEAALLVGVVGALLLSVTLYLAQTALARARETESARQGLQSAIEIRKGIEESLRASEQRFRDFGEIASDWFWETGRDGCFTRIIGPRYEQCTGVAIGDVVGVTRGELHAQYLLPSEQKKEDKWRAFQGIIDAHEEYRDFELGWRRPDGEERALSISGKPVFDSDGAFVGYRGVGRDITHLKEQEQALLQSEERFSKAFHLSPALIALIDAETGSYVDVNAAFLNAFGYELDDLIGKTPADLGIWVDGEKHRAFFEELRSEGSARNLDIEARGKDGNAVWIAGAAEAIEIDGRPHWLLSGEDITERNQAEVRIREQAALLEERNEELARSNEELDDFAYIVSHDLKEPLRGISNYATFIMEDYGVRLDDKGREMLETLPRLAGRLGSLIDDLLRLSRVGRADLGIKDTNLNETIGDVTDSLKAFLDELNVEVRIPRPLPTISCDSVRVSEVYRNLITNGAKYNDKDKRFIEIGYEPNGSAATVPNEAHTNGNGLVFYVKDNGIGIPEKHQDNVFRIFKRLHGRDKYHGGTGAGLTIVRKIIERHGGRIWIDSEPGHGTKFSFTLSER